MEHSEGVVVEGDSDCDLPSFAKGENACNVGLVQWVSFGFEIPMISCFIVSSFRIWITPVTGILSVYTNVIPP